MSILNVPDRVRNIGNSAFYTNKLTGLTLPDFLKTIGYEAFMDNELTVVEVDINTNVANNAFDSNVDVKRVEEVFN